MNPLRKSDMNITPAYYPFTHQPLTTNTWKTHPILLLKKISDLNTQKRQSKLACHLTSSAILQLHQALCIPMTAIVYSKIALTTLQPLKSFWSQWIQPKIRAPQLTVLIWGACYSKEKIYALIGVKYPAFENCTGLWMFCGCILGCYDHGNNISSVFNWKWYCTSLLFLITGSLKTYNSLLIYSWSGGFYL